jgi:esterase/lipase superfamily enzyme
VAQKGEDDDVKATEHWYSERLGRWIGLARWGHYGTPVLVFPTAGGDAEEVERNGLVDACRPLLDAGRIKIYSCDSVAGAMWFSKQGSPDERMKIQHQFHQYVKHEVVPAIRIDCRTPDIGIWAAGSSIGAFHAAAVVCRFPDLFHRALSMSGTYNLMRFIEVPEPNEEFRVSSPLHFLPQLEGPHLELLRKRYIHIATGEGRWEDIGESWALANALGAKRIPNHLDSWGPGWDHDWVTWRAMMPNYLEEWTR